MGELQRGPGGPSQVKRCGHAALKPPSLATLAGWYADTLGLLVSAAALVRVLGAWLPGLDYPAVIVLSAALWTAAFAFFLWVYGPILLMPRIDARTRP